MLEPSSSIAPYIMPPFFLERKLTKNIERFPHSCQKGNAHSNTAKKTLSYGKFEFLMVFF